MMTIMGEEGTAMTIIMVAGTMTIMEEAMLQAATDTTGGSIRTRERDALPLLGPTAARWPN